MKKVVLKALKGSIQHWEQNVRTAREGRYIDIRTGWEDCPLCCLFINRCNGCPVEEAGYYSCSGTPYQNVLRSEGKKVFEACKAEVKFLRSLLPKTKKRRQRV
jgi:hypothetical protein